MKITSLNVKKKFEKLTIIIKLHVGKKLYRIFFFSQAIIRVDAKEQDTLNALWKSCLYAYAFSVYHLLPVQ